MLLSMKLAKEHEMVKKTNYNILSWKPYLGLSEQNFKTCQDLHDWTCHREGEYSLHHHQQLKSKTLFITFIKQTRTYCWTKQQLSEFSALKYNTEFMTYHDSQIQQRQSLLTCKRLGCRGHSANNSCTRAMKSSRTGFTLTTSWMLESW